MEGSFWIESKLFKFSRKGGNFFYILEKSRKLTKNLSLSGDMVLWMAKVVDDCLR